MRDWDATASDNVLRLPFADAVRSVRHVFVRDLVVQAQIGVWDHEKGAGQPVRINVDLAVREAAEGHADRLDNVVCYNQVVDGIERIIAEGHINLVETLAERIAAMTLADPRVESARIRVEKLDAVARAASVGVEIERHKPR